MKIETVTLTDVLSHVESRIAVGEHLTVFTGTSDSGKSGTMRGLNQLCRNQPAGIDLLRHGAKRGACSEVAMGILTAEGKRHSVVRRRGKSKNEYEVDGQTLLAIGRDVPEEVAGLLHLSEHAFQLQSDGNFMLCRTDGEVAKMLSSTVGLAQIDAAFSAVNSRKTVNDTALRVAQADCEREKAAAAGFAGLPVADDLVTEAERLATETTAATDAVSDMTVTAELFSAQPPDRGEDIVRCSHYIRNADAAERSAVACGNMFGDMRWTLEFLDRTPVPRVMSGIAQVVAVAEVSSSAYAKAADAYTHMRILSEELGGLRGDTGMMPRRATLLMTQAKTADQKRDEADTALNEICVLLAKMDHVRPACYDEISETDRLCSFAVSKTQDAENQEAWFGKMTELVDKLATTVFNGTTYASNIKFADQEIERYKREHPVCPECGAEQRHWHNGE